MVFAVDDLAEGASTKLRQSLVPVMNVVTLDDLVESSRSIVALVVHFGHVSQTRSCYPKRTTIHSADLTVIAVKVRCSSAPNVA